MFYCAGIIEYEDGSKFEGGIKKGVREGKGTLYYAPGDVYEGTWHNNMRFATKNVLQTPHHLPLQIASVRRCR